jgi:hypothetical protein
MRMYHPQLGVERDVPDEPACVAVHEDGGWRPAPTPERQSAAHEPEPVTYAPVDGAGGALVPPDGTVDDVLGWVDGDPARARAALDAEQAREKPRSTLVTDLEGVLAAD